MAKLKIWQWIFLIFSILITISFINSGYPPEFYDNFGLLVFGFLFGLGIWMVNTKKEVPSWAEFLVLLLAILGLLVDGAIVLRRLT